MAILKRESWSEAEVVALPHGEHDYFDRKAGALLDDRENFSAGVSKALSAFANSGGGHLVIGMLDDAVTFDGLPSTVGRTSTREWLEQKIPSLLSYELQDFRVHEVTRDEPSAIPAGRIVLVVDVGDSPLAPHQTTQGGKNYYVRQGGHSRVAPHHWLELLRQRVSGPVVQAVCEEIRVREVYRNPADAIVVRFEVDFVLRNEGRIAAYKWELFTWDYTTSGELNNPDFRFDPNNMPIRRNPGLNDSSISIGDDTILPGRARRQIAHVALFVRPEQERPHLIQRETERILQTVICYRVATETYRGDNISVAFAKYLDADSLRATICEQLNIQ
jgi:hypothetical protein